MLMMASALVACEGDPDDYLPVAPRPTVDAAVPDALVFPAIPESCAAEASCIEGWWVRVVGPDCPYACSDCGQPECRADDCVCSGADLYEIHPEAGNQRHTLIFMHSPGLRRFTLMEPPNRFPWTLNEQCRMVDQGALTGMAYSCDDTRFDIGVFMQSRPEASFEIALENAFDRQAPGSYSY